LWRCLFNLIFNKELIEIMIGVSTLKVRNAFSEDFFLASVVVKSLIVLFLKEDVEIRIVVHLKK